LIYTNALNKKNHLVKSLALLEL